ncbi:MAG TPA: hypothetical protein VGB14_13345 [Acidimicrobiales bacterium]
MDTPDFTTAIRMIDAVAGSALGDTPVPKEPEPLLLRAIRLAIDALNEDGADTEDGDGPDKRGRLMAAAVLGIADAYMACYGDDPPPSTRYIAGLGAGASVMARQEPPNWPEPWRDRLPTAPRPPDAWSGVGPTTKPYPPFGFDRASIPKPWRRARAALVREGDQLLERSRQGDYDAALRLVAIYNASAVSGGAAAVTTATLSEIAAAFRDDLYGSVAEHLPALCDEGEPLAEKVAAAFTDLVAGRSFAEVMAAAEVVEEADRRRRAEWRPDQAVLDALRQRVEGIVQDGRALLPTFLSWALAVGEARDTFTSVFSGNLPDGADWPVELETEMFRALDDLTGVVREVVAYDAVYAVGQDEYDTRAALVQGVIAENFGGPVAPDDPNDVVGVLSGEARMRLWKATLTGRSLLALLAAWVQREAAPADTCLNRGLRPLDDDSMRRLLATLAADLDVNNVVSLMRGVLESFQAGTVLAWLPTTDDLRACVGDLLPADVSVVRWHDDGYVPVEALPEEGGQ